MDPVTSLNHAARIALDDCLNLKPGEELLVLTDPSRTVIAHAFVDTARQSGIPVIYTEMPQLVHHGQEPPAAIARLMCEFDVVVIPTMFSLSHTDACRRACDAGARIATMPGILEETMRRCLSADYHAIAERTQKVSRILTAGQRVRVLSAAGTDLEFSIEGMTAFASTGLIHSRGSRDNLPSGECSIRPADGSANGTVVIDGSMAEIGHLEPGGEIIQIHFQDGLAVRIEGGEAATRLQELLASTGPAAFTLAEFGVGTNDAARIIGNTLEDEKVMGTIHVSLGNNIALGGNADVPIHLDGVVRQPTVQVDDKIIVQNGELFIT